MKKLSVVASLFAGLASAQIGRTLDWPTFANDPQRTGWEKSDARFTKDEVAKNFQLLFKMKTEGKQSRSLMPPVIVGTLVGSRGFKELAFFAGADDSMMVVDADLSRIYWQRRVENGKASGVCPGATSAMPTLLPISFRRPVPRPTPGAPPARPTPNPIFAPRSIYFVSSSGMLHRINIDSGEPAVPAVRVVPANTKSSTLNINDNVLYATSTSCDGATNTVWSMDLSEEGDATPKVVSYTSHSGIFAGMGGPAVGTDGTIYAQGANGLVALTARDLKEKNVYMAPASAVTPVVFAYKQHDMIVTAGKDGRLNLLDSTGLALLAQSAQVTGGDGALWGGLSTWEEAEGARWVLATVWGASSSGAKNGSITAFKIEDHDGKPAFTQGWTSSDLVKPVPPVIASGVVFALANGDRQTHASLHALDGLTGREIWSTGSQITSAGSLTGLTVANGRVFFSTVDNTLWAFGVPLEW